MPDSQTQRDRVLAAVLVAVDAFDGWWRWRVAHLSDDDLLAGLGTNPVKRVARAAFLEAWSRAGAPATEAEPVRATPAAPPRVQMRRLQLPSLADDLDAALVMRRTHVG